MKIYKITNLVNNKIYIGQTLQKNPKMRWYGHLSDAKRGKKSHLYDSIRKYGKESFVWEIIEHCSSLEELNAREQYWLEYYRSLTEVYNCREAGGNKTHRAESIEKMKVAQRAAHARRRMQGGGIETMNRTVKTAGWTNSEQGKLNKRLAALRREANKRGEL